MKFLTCMVIGAFVGWLSGRFLGRYGFSAVIDMVMGIFGGLVGAAVLAPSSTVVPGGSIVIGLAAMQGAALMTVLVALASGQKRLFTGVVMRRSRLHGLPVITQPDDVTLY